MPGSKYERELRFIDTETARLNYLKTQIMESMPADPAEAKEKAAQVQEMENQIAEFLARKKEIEDSFVAVGLDVPNMHKSMNASVYNRVSDEFEAVPPSDSFSYAAYSVTNPSACPAQAAAQAVAAAPAAAPAPEMKPVAEVSDIDEELNNIAQELIQLEMKLMQAEIRGDDDGMVKAKASINILRERRDALVQEIKERKAEEEKAAAAAAAPNTAELEKKIADLEADIKSLRSQMSMVRSSSADMMEKIRQIMYHLHIEEDDDF